MLSYWPTVILSRATDYDKGAIRARGESRGREKEKITTGEITVTYRCNGTEGGPVRRVEGNWGTIYSDIWEA